MTNYDWIEYQPPTEGQAPEGYDPTLDEVEFGGARGWHPVPAPAWHRGCLYRWRGPARVVADRPSLPDDASKRLEYPMADGLLDYFPNALAEVSRLSHAATQQHHPDQEMHWDRGKSTDHANKIIRHLVDRGKLDDKGMRHSAMVAWRALALLQEELEQTENLPPSRASRNRPF